MPGRVESYIHSDSLTSNKGGCIVEVSCATDFAAKTDEFIAFSKKVAMFAYGANTGYWADVAEMFPEIEAERKSLSEKLKEDVVVRKISIVSLDSKDNKNYTKPNDLSHIDNPKEWLSASLIFSAAMSHLLDHGEGVVVELKGDMILPEMASFSKVVVLNDGKRTVIEGLNEESETYEDGQMMYIDI